VGKLSFSCSEIGLLLMSWIMVKKTWQNWVFLVVKYLFTHIGWICVSRFFA